MRFANTLKFDIQFQFRHGFYYAYLFVTVIYALALINLAPDLRASITTLLLFTDTAMIGFFFIGGVVLLEKGQNIFEALFSTPIRLREYLLSKIVSLTFLATLSSLAIVFAAHGLPAKLTLFILGFFCSSCVYTLFGIIFACYARNVNDYFAKAMGFGILLSLPLVEYTGLFSLPIFYLFPSKATILLLDVIVKNSGTPQLVYAFVCLIIWTVIAWVVAKRTMHNKIIYKIGSAQ